MVETRPKTSMYKQKCPLNDEDIDVIPENYHFANRCICFMCLCGQHICPNTRKTVATKDNYKTDYKRSYSRPAMTPTLQRVPVLYHRNRQKMDLDTEYRRKYSNFVVEVVQVPHSISPTPSFKLEGQSQYNRDYPNWGPVDYCNTKRPVHPVHETKLKFQGKSSYEAFFQPMKLEENTKKNKVEAGKGEVFVVPMQTSSQRDYKKIGPGNYPQHIHREVQEYSPINFSPAQFKSVARVSYVDSGKHKKDPYLVRKKAMFHKSIK